MSHAQRVLLLEPNRYHALLLRREFERQLPSVVLTHYRDVDPALSEALRSPYDVCLIAHSERRYNAETIVGRIRDRGLEVPVIVLAESATMLLVQHLEELGVKEVIIKNDTFSHVVPRLVAALFNREGQTPSDKTTHPQPGKTALGPTEKLVASATHIHTAVEDLLAAQRDLDENIREQLLAIDRDARFLCEELTRENTNHRTERTVSPELAPLS